MAGDSLNRGLPYDQANPYANQRNIAYTVNDDVRVMSDHDKHCLSAIDLDLQLRYTQSWLPEGQEVKNEYLLFLLKAIHGRKPYTNETRLTKSGRESVFESWKPGAYYRPQTVNTAIANDAVCGRDHKWRLVDQAIYRKECNCANFFRVTIALYRFWLCTWTEPLSNLGIGSVKNDDCGYAQNIRGKHDPDSTCAGGRDFWFPRIHPNSLDNNNSHVCKFNNTFANILNIVNESYTSQNSVNSGHYDINLNIKNVSLLQKLPGVVNLRYGRIKYDESNPAIGMANQYLNDDFLDLTAPSQANASFQINWFQNKIYHKFDELKHEIEKEYLQGRDE